LNRACTMLSAHAAAHARPTPVEKGRANLRVAPLRRSSPGSVLLRACRLRQWVKNVIVAIAPAAAGALTRPAVAAETAGALVAFCLLASATYLFNDVRDLEQDRLHPRKRHRPIAAGELTPRGAVRIASLLAVAGLALSLAVRPTLAVVALCYLALTTTYSFCWRHVAVADMLVVAGGFVLRAAGGGVAAAAPLSRSFLVVTSACALFLVAGKRYAELGSTGLSLPTRVTVGRHSFGLLRAVLALAGAVACAAYARWAFDRHAAGPWFVLSIVPLALWLGRYAVMLGSGAGEAPEELILGDPALLAIAGAWAALFVGGVYGGQ
jgi:decaprenyl-phosphate phosphoribosyltransferase